MVRESTLYKTRLAFLSKGGRKNLEPVGAEKDQERPTHRGDCISVDRGE